MLKVNSNVSSNFKTFTKNAFRSFAKLVKHGKNNNCINGQFDHHRKFGMFLNIPFLPEDSGSQ